MKRMFPYYRECLIGVITFIVIATGSIIVRTNFTVRVKELNALLEYQNLTSSGTAHADLIATYVRQKALYEKRLQQDQAALEETLYKQFVPISRSAAQTSAPLTERPAIFIINVFRWMIAKSPISVQKNIFERFPVYTAFSLEREKEYRKAAALYSYILSARAPGQIPQNVLLHRGFCYAMLEEYENARADYVSVLSRYAASETAFIASILLRYMDEFNSEKEVVLQHGASVDAGEKVAILLGSRKALAILDAVAAGNPAEKAKIDYYKGICYEEMGEREQSKECYTRAVESDAASEFTRSANRKLYALAIETTNTIVLSGVLAAGTRQKDTTLLAVHDAIFEATNDVSPATAHNAIIISRSTNSASKKRAAPMQPIHRVHAAVMLPGAHRDQSIAVFSGKRVRVETIDRDVFNGVLLSDTPDDCFTIATIAGPIAIAKSNVRSLSLQSK